MTHEEEIILELLKRCDGAVYMAELSRLSLIPEVLLWPTIGSLIKKDRVRLGMNGTRGYIALLDA